jgi:hypothetical protein
VGVVNDQTQAVIPGATLKIENLDDGRVRSATSDQNGAISVAARFLVRRSRVMPKTVIVALIAGVFAVAIVTIAQKAVVRKQH